MTLKETFKNRKLNVIMACNGIGTPRILLNSKSKYFPNGIANNSGQVGKSYVSSTYWSRRIIR